MILNYIFLKLHLSSRKKKIDVPFKKFLGHVYYSLEKKSNHKYIHCVSEINIFHTIPFLSPSVLFTTPTLSRKKN